MKENEFVDRETHEGIERNSWDLLIRAAHKSKEPFHFPVFGTTNSDDPELRVVVLRQAIREKKTLIIHTDIRSEKIKHLRENPNASLLFYDNRRLIQLRFKTLATIHHQDDIAALQWQNAAPSSRKVYLGKTPGMLSAEATHGLPEHLAGEVPSLEESEAGFVNFAAIICQVTFMDWLWLFREGHRRAQFSYEADGNWSANWVMP